MLATVPSKMAVFDANIAWKQFHKQFECIVGKVHAYVYRHTCIHHPKP